LIDPWEVIMIGAVVLVLLMWGPQKIPELAKSLGQAKHELERASKGDAKDREKKV
jgi:sec-independent protein translocase protein TatA